MVINIKFDKLDVDLSASLSKDGEKWCVLFGDNLQVGICGFGYTILTAIEDFKRNFYKS